MWERACSRWHLRDQAESPRHLICIASKPAPTKNNRHLRSIFGRKKNRQIKAKLPGVAIVRWLATPMFGAYNRAWKHRAYPVHKEFSP